MRCKRGTDCTTYRDPTRVTRVVHCAHAKAEHQSAAVAEEIDHSEEGDEPASARGSPGASRCLRRAPRGKENGRHRASAPLGARAGRWLAASPLRSSSATSGTVSNRPPPPRRTASLALDPTVVPRGTVPERPATRRLLARSRSPPTCGHTPSAPRYGLGCASCFKQLPNTVFQQFDGPLQGAQLSNPRYRHGQAQVK